MVAAIQVNGSSMPVDIPNQPLNAALLPVADSPDLELVPATSAEIHQSWLLNSKDWKGALTMDQYIGRERHLSAQDLTKDGKLTAWILTSPKLPPYADGTRPFFAGCETTQKHAYVAQGGVLKDKIAHGIGSVYTRPEYRGRGYAARMMTEVAKRLETYQQSSGEHGTLSVLYSDIGQKFYARFGWKAYPSTHIHLESIDEDRYQMLRPRVRQIVKKGIPEVHDLTVSDLEHLSASAYLEDELKVMSENDSNVPYVAIRPDLAHMQWHHAREEYQCKTLNKPSPDVKGAIHKDTGIAVVWCRVYSTDPSANSLHVLHVIIPPKLKVGPTADDHLALAALLLRAQKEAYASGMHAGVEVWNPSGFVMTSAQKLRIEEEGNVTVIRRDKEHICSLKWIGQRADDTSDGDVVWLHNEKYAWC